MENLSVFLQTLVVVLGVAAVITIIFHKLKQPVVLGYLLAGMIVGPHVPIPLVAHEGIVHILAELGVILLMFSLGLEFSLSKLTKVIPTAGFIALLQSSLMVWIGYVVGQLLGWSVIESVYAGAVIAISSTTIIVKVFSDQGLKGPLTHIVFGVLIVEDLIAILLMAFLNTFSSGAGLSIGKVFHATGYFTLFLLAVLVIGILIIPRLIRMIVSLNRPETSLIASVGIGFGLAYIAQSAGYSVALGAFLAGALIAESGKAESIEHQVQPLRDLFGAIFFVAVGMMIDPALIAAHWQAILIFFVVVLVGKVLGVAVGTFLMGNDLRLSVKAGMSLAQIGEFSFIIAGIGLSTGATSPTLYSIAVAVSALTTFTTPWLIRFSDPFAYFIDRHLPKPLQSFVSLYGSWIQDWRHAGHKSANRSRLWRLVRRLAIDTFFCTAVIITAALVWSDATQVLLPRLQWPVSVLHAAMYIGVIILALPFAIGIIRLSRGVGLELASHVMPVVQSGDLDRAAAPRRTLIVTLQLMVFLLVGFFMLAVTQPVLPLLQTFIVFVGCLLLISFIFWRSADNLQGHVKAGAQMVIETLTSGIQAAEKEKTIEDLLPGLGSITPVELPPKSQAIGKTLSELDLRGMTGASVVAIVRASGNVVTPTGKEALKDGDILAMTGPAGAIQEARRVLM